MVYRSPLKQQPASSLFCLEASTPGESLVRDQPGLQDHSEPFRADLAGRSHRHGHLVVHTSDSADSRLASRRARSRTDSGWCTRRVPPRCRALLRRRAVPLGLRGLRRLDHHAPHRACRRRGRNDPAPDGKVFSLRQPGMVLRPPVHGLPAGSSVAGRGRDVGPAARALRHPARVAGAREAPRDGRRSSWPHRSCLPLRRSSYRSGT
jgi:hypothetical protein